MNSISKVKNFLKRIRRYLILPAILAICLSVYTAVPCRADGMEIHYIDVGQGDAALITCDGQSMLIDGGNSASSSRIYTYLKSHGIKHLDYIVGTHADEDHIGGLAGALNAVTVETAFCSVTENDTAAFRNFEKYLKLQGRDITVPALGETHKLGNAAFQVVSQAGAAGDSNNNSIVIRLVYGNTAFLFTGDAELEEENLILNSGIDIRSDVLKVAHHGSRTSTGDRFLKKVNPSTAIISVGAGNTYGHPTEEVLNALARQNIKVYRTDRDGDILCKSDGKTITFSTAKTVAVEAPAVGVVADNADDFANNTNNRINNADGNTDYICNMKSQKFHYPNCESVKKMSEKNKLEFSGSRDELIAKGYSPCGNCRP